jgi:putative redox protein
MTASDLGRPPMAQATAGGSLEDGGTLIGRAGPSEFPLGGPDGRGGTSGGPNPYDLLSAALAACTAMTIRLHGRHKAYPLSHVDVAVTYRHGGNNGRNFFERHITLRGALDDQERMQLLRGAESCPVGRAWASA